MKGINCCGECANYNYKKHKCSICVDEGKATDRFYADCPLPDAEEEKRGKWELIEDIIEDYARCTHCNEEYACSCHLTFDHWKRYAKYCPNCGAKMDLGEKECAL